jgi:hypothetical protein
MNYQRLYKEKKLFMLTKRMLEEYNYYRPTSRSRE